MSSELFIDYLPRNRLQVGADFFFECVGEAFPEFFRFDEHIPNSPAVSISAIADSNVIFVATCCPVFRHFTAVAGIRS
jgi:hypothetical protein